MGSLMIELNRPDPAQQQGAAAAGRAESSGEVTAATGEAVTAIKGGRDRGRESSINYIV
jgi:hypothetical protein